MTDASSRRDPADVVRPERPLSIRLLESFYKHVVPLSSLFPSIELFKEEDVDGYRELVQHLVVGHNSEQGKPAIEVEVGYDFEVDMRDIIEQAHGRIFAAHARLAVRAKKAGSNGSYISGTPRNVLCLGYRLPKSWQDDRITSRGGGSTAVTNFFPNTIVASIKRSPHWQTLLSRIGSHAMLQLLATSELGVFTKLKNDCLVQLAGTIIANVDPLPREEPIKPKRKRRRVQEVAGQTEGDQARRRKRRRRKIATEQEAEEVITSAPKEVPAIRIDSPEAAPVPTRVRGRALGPSTSAPELANDVGTFRLTLQPVSALALRPTASVGDLSGSETSKRPAEEPCAAQKPPKRLKLAQLHTPNEVVFSRHRIYHARPSKTKGASGKPKYGLPPNHILVRLPNLFSFEVPTTADKGYAEARARHLAKYVFPRQYGLHNPFTFPRSNSRSDVLPDYDERELSIKRLGSIKTPERLKLVLPLLDRLMLLHGRTSFRKLLDQSCPRKTSKSKKPRSQSQKSDLTQPGSQLRTQVSRGDISLDTSHPSQVIAHGAEVAASKVKAKPEIHDYACSPREVERFIEAVVRACIPVAFWGSTANAKNILKHIVAFLRLRRFESMTVHTFLQGFCVADCDWLRPASFSKKRNFHQKQSVQEVEKQKEILADFLFWFVDGFLVNLIKNTFYVTDSAQFRNRAVFFRQDDWDFVTKPLLKRLADTTFEKISNSAISSMLQERQLSFAYVRLLPKITGCRPIVNLARRPILKATNGRLEVGKTINEVLQNSFDVMTYEKKRRPTLVGALVLSPQDIHERLKAFKSKLMRDGRDNLPKLYFVKVDVEACYDTIQQNKLLQIVEQVLDEDEYWIQKFSQTTMVDGRPVRQSKRKACTEGERGSFFGLANTLVDELHNAVLADQVHYPNAKREDVLKLLKEHITSNLVKIGRRLYRQKEGIPQGSILSSLLCSLFYGDMENKKLVFTKEPTDCAGPEAAPRMLLRYVDDFLFVSTDRELATRFLRVMGTGLPEYGCRISTEKRLTNFDVALSPGELVVPHKSEASGFPWCGLMIDTATLDVSASIATHVESEIADKLTVQRHRKPGKSFVSAMMRAVKIRAHIIFNDTTHNAKQTVYFNTYQALLVVALKFQAYVREWSVKPGARAGFFTNVIRDIVNYQYTLVQSRARAKAARDSGTRAELRKDCVLWLGYHAFHRVLSTKAPIYKSILDALREELAKPKMRVAAVRMAGIVENREHDFVQNALKKRTGKV